MQPSLLLSPSSSNKTLSTSVGLGGTIVTNNQLYTGGIDEKSLKDIIDILTKRIDLSKNLLEFSQVLQIDNINLPTISGHTDFYYPNLSYPISTFQQEIPEISKIKGIAIPDELIQQFSQMQVSCFMGLFTSISRAWLAIDNFLFFWNYEDGSDICFYDNLNEPILAVELFHPKPGTFDDGVEYGLCLATNSTVILLSIDFIRFTKGNGAIVNEMRFSPQPIYSIPTDNLIINTLKAAKTTGRIFMGGKDGSLYEFFYQNQTSWFSSQSKKINLSHSKFYYLVPSIFSFNDADSIIQIEIDESRNVLYTRSENSTIQVFYLGPNGTEISKISYLTCNTIASKAATLINSNDKHLFMPIINISTIKHNESKNITLVAVTQFGIRLYFSLNPFQQFQQLENELNLNPNIQKHISQSIPPSVFQLVHVRIPPNIELSSQNRNGPVSSAYYNNGVTLMVSKRDEQNDSVLLLNRDLFLLHPNFKESKTVFDIGGRIWHIEEIVPSLSCIRSAAMENDLLQTITSASGDAEYIPKPSSEYFDLPRRYAMITPQGCFVWNKLRPIDQLSLVLKESHGPNSESVRLFFNKIYERAEACSLCLAVALLHSNTDARIYEWATQAFFIYSGEPEIRKKSSVSFGSTATSSYQTQFHQPNLNQHQPYQNYPQSSLISDSGMEPNENSMYGDVTLLSNRFGLMHQKHVSYLNSPQQMSTPIMMRTKDQISPAPYQTQQSQQRPFQSISTNVQFSQHPSQFQIDSQIKPVTSSIQHLDSKKQHQQSECEIFFSGKHDAIYIYLTRLLAPIWDSKLLKELTIEKKTDNPSLISDNNQNLDQFLFATFNEINIQWFLNKLNELRHFLDTNFPHLKTLQQTYLNGALFPTMSSSLTTSTISSNPAKLGQNQPKFATQFSNMPLNMAALINLTSSGLNINNYGHHLPPISEEKLAIEIENGSIFLLRQFINRIIEIFGLLKILDDHKFHFISQKLDKQTQLLMMNMQIKTFLLSDDNLLEQLITALLYRYIDDNANTDQLNMSLKQMCPSLYTNENAIFSKSCEKLKQALNIKNDNYERDRLLKEAVDLMKQIGYVANLTQVCDMLYSAGCYEAIFELSLTAVEKRDPQNIALHYYNKSEPPEDLQGQHYFNLRSECYNCMLDCLNSLVKTPSLTLTHQNKQILAKEKIDEKVNSLIKFVVNSKDELAHIFLFNWMIKNGMEKKLVTLDSIYLQNFLIKEIKEQSKNRIYLDLLWRHYDFKKDYVNTAKVLTALAEKYSESQITLKERVEYLAQAIVALNSSSKANVKDEVTELNDKKDVALLQEKIFEELSRIEPKNESIQEALIQLDSQLFDITKLYYDFAEKFDLFQCQLAIFKMSRHEDSNTIEILWKRIIADELDKISSADIKPSDLKNQLAENIINIGKEYSEDDEKYFPLVVLIDSLEFVSLSRGFEPEWASNLLRKLNIPFNQLIQAYNSVYLRKDVKWAENSSRFINAIYSLIELFTKAPNATNENDKAQFLQSVKDLIPKYLTELNGINDDLSRDLISRLKTLNYMLERM